MNDSSKKTQSPKKRKNGQDNPSWFSGIFSKLSLKPKNQMILPDDKEPSIVWDEKTKRWTNLNEDENDGGSVTQGPPPKDSELMRGGPPPPPSQNGQMQQPTPNFQIPSQNLQVSNPPVPSLNSSSNQFTVPNNPYPSMYSSENQSSGGSSLPPPTQSNNMYKLQKRSKCTKYSF